MGHVNFAYAHYLIDKAAEYIRKQSTQTMPFILCGDMNSLPSSSVISAFYGEDIEKNTSQFEIPGTLSDRTKFRGREWSQIKDEALAEDFEEHAWFTCLEPI